VKATVYQKYKRNDYVYLNQRGLEVPSEYHDFNGGIDAVRRRMRALALKWISRTRARYTYRFFTDGIGYIDQQIGADGLFEKGLIDHMIAVSKQYRHQALYIDVGANIGNHLVAIAPHFKRAVGFDPHPVLFKILEANVLANGLEHVDLYNTGLGQMKCNATLVESATNHGLSRVKDFSKLSAETFGLCENEFSIKYSIAIEKAEDALAAYAEHLSGALIKIDVEGMEAEILTSLASLIHEYRPIVAFEWFREEQPELTQFIKQLQGYRAMGCFIEQSANPVRRLLSNLLHGRRYELRDMSSCDNVSFFPLVFLIPEPVKPQ